MQTISETSSETKHKQDLKLICEMAYKKGLVSGCEGNFSIKVSDDLILVTPKNSNKGIIREEDFVLVDFDGNTISNGYREPTSELALHLEAYRKRPDINAVVHAHPPTLVSFSIAGLDFNQPVIPEIIVLLGEVPTVPYSTPGTTELANITATFLEKHDAVVLERHGAVTLGKDIYSAYFKLESLEHAAKIVHSAYTLGEVKTLDEKSLNELVKQRHSIYGEEVELREGSKLFQSSNQKLQLKTIFKKLIDNNTPVFQRVLTLVNELNEAIIDRTTTYSQKLSKEEKEQLAKELTSSTLAIVLERFSKRKF